MAKMRQGSTGKFSPAATTLPEPSDTAGKAVRVDRKYRQRKQQAQNMEHRTLHKPLDPQAWMHHGEVRALGSQLRIFLR
ncbi:MAG: hypothetical protein ACI87W_003405 [Halieaceae bacterium]|jgi:hypothetical protein